MVRNGFKIMDSDMHVLEPPDLWQTRYRTALRRECRVNGRWTYYIRTSLRNTSGRVRPSTGWLFRRM